MNVPENPTTHITSLTVDSPTVVNTLHVPRTRVMLVTIVISVVLIVHVSSGTCTQCEENCGSGSYRTQCSALYEDIAQL